MHAHRLTHWVIFSAPLLAILAALWIAFPSENDVVLFFNDHRAAYPMVKTVLKFITDWCNPAFYAYFAYLLFTAYRSRDRERMRFIFILLASQLVISVLAVHFAKSAIGRPRPNQGAVFEPFSSSGSQHSLPSGHTTEIIGWSLPLVLRNGKFRLTALFGLFVGIVGFSRIYLGWHHPTDVFFGWLLGSVGGFATVIIAETNIFRRS